VKLLNLVVAAVAAALLASCASPFYVHDPKFGLVSNDQLPGLIKSLRCELVTYYQTTYKRQRHYASDKLPYFDLDNNLWGAFNLDLKVVDALGVLGTNSVYSNKLSAPDATHSKTLTVGPTAGLNDTYELSWSFSIKQNADLTGRKAVPVRASPDENFECYSAVPDDLEGLSYGKYTDSGIELFKRIYVNGFQPLAGWLLDNSDVMASSYSFLNEKADNEKAYPSQMIYTFTVSASGGVDAKFTLISSRWNPLQPDASASISQTSMLTLYINGQRAIVYNNAKSGNVLIVGKKPDATNVVIVGQKTDIGVVERKSPGGGAGGGASLDGQKPAREPNYSPGVAPGRGKDYGTPIYPYGIVPPQ
jgi:hypothetical protein